MPAREDSVATALLRELWPPPARIVEVSWPQARRLTAPLSFLPVPQRGQPTMFIPRRPWRVAATAISRYKTSAPAGVGRKLKLLGAAARLGATELAPRAVLVFPEGEGIVAHLSAVIGLPVHVGIHVGPARAVQKPVLQLIDPAGRTCGFAKVGTRPLTRRLVRAEAATLATLTATPHQAFRVPRVLASGPFGDNEIAVLEPLTPSAYPAEHRTLVDHAIAELSTVGRVTESLRGSAYWSLLRERLDGLPPSQYSKRIRISLDRLDAAAGAMRLGFGAAHGDWAPWNMAIAGRQVILWDWEYFRPQVPVGFDAIHYRIQADVARGHEPVDAFVSAATNAGDLTRIHDDLDPRAAGVVMLLYTIDLAMRYLIDGELEAGTVMGRLGAWLDTVVDRQDQLVGPSPEPGRVP